MAVSPALLLPLALLSAASAIRVDADTPVDKVITLLEDLETKIGDEGKAEATTYDTFACFCKDTTATKSGAITSGHQGIDSLSATIELDVATKATKAGELAERIQKDEELKRSLAEVQAKCLAEITEFEATWTDLDKATKALTKAIAAMEASKPTTLLSLSSSIKDSLALADALSLSVPKEQQAFLQQGVDPESPEYKYRSNEILKMLEKLLTDFTTKATDVKTEWDKAVIACDDLKTSLTDELTVNSDAIVVLKQDLARLETDIATNRESLILAEGTLKDDQSYLQDLTKRCEARALDWDQRSQLRSGELQAIAEALAILRDGSQGDNPTKSVKEMDTEVNKRALLLGVKAPRPAKRAPTVPALLQQDMEPHTGASNARGVRGVAAASAAGQVPSAQHSFVQHKVSDLLHKEGKRLDSRMLSSLAAQIAADPFAKVKVLIQNLIERLLSEATQEATKKGFCDEEIGKAVQNRDFRMADVHQLLSELSLLHAKQGKLLEDIQGAKESIAALQKALNSSTVDRAADKEQNLATMKTAKEGVEAVTTAITILKDFYKNAAKAKVFMQASPVDEDTTGAGFEGAYKGQQEGAGGVIGLLEVIRSDFERTLRSTEAAEKKAQEDFVEFDRTSRVDITSKETALDLNIQDLEITSSKIKQGLIDLHNTQALVDAALKTMADLKPVCIDTSMTFAERTAKREEEIAALKKALCILDPNLVEPECS
mmetsp:Transcript_16846/g.39527  ORF Transcript_16846/g.39527 Transcript_16846/m.39527 type:complete len:719 (-) Transcript_16846:66-2222(-)